MLKCTNLDLFISFDQISVEIRSDIIVCDHLVGNNSHFGFIADLQLVHPLKIDWVIIGSRRPLMGLTLNKRLFLYIVDIHVDLSKFNFLRISREAEKIGTGPWTSEHAGSNIK